MRKQDIQLSVVLTVVPWKIHASPVGDSTTFRIKSYIPEHICVLNRNILKPYLTGSQRNLFVYLGTIQR